MRHRVVLVDDIAELRHIIRLLLEHSGWFEVVGEADSGAAAVTAAERLRPDVMLLDVEMPGGLSGWEALPLIKQVSPDTPVVVFSGSPADTSAPGKEPLAAAVVEKGIAPQELVRLLLAIVTGDTEGAAPVPPPLEVATSTPAPPARAPGRGLLRMTPEELAARLVALVESASDAIIAKSLTGEILSWNPAATRIYGYEPEEVIGKSIAVLVPPDRPDEVPAILRRIAAGERVEQFETVRVRRDGSTVDVSITVSPVVDTAGRVIGASTIARDISGRREADAALAWAVAQLELRNRELRRSNDELDAFASVASHDLAQPLQVAHGYLELIQEAYGAGLDPTAREWLEAASSSLDRMRLLVRDILTFARTGSGDLVPEDVDLAAVAAAAREAVAPLLAERGAEVEIDPLPRISGSEGQLVQLLQNLIANAVKFVPEDRQPHVRVSSEDTAEGVILDVDDNGTGVPVGARDRVFGMFQRGDASAASGSGLGLATCRRIVTRHGGRIWIEDAPGGGARFRVFLPASDPGGVDFGEDGGLT